MSSEHLRVSVADRSPTRRVWIMLPMKYEAACRVCMLSSRECMNQAAHDSHHISRLDKKREVTRKGTQDVLLFVVGMTHDQRRKVGRQDGNDRLFLMDYRLVSLFIHIMRGIFLRRKLLPTTRSLQGLKQDWQKRCWGGSTTLNCMLITFIWVWLSKVQKGIRFPSEKRRDHRRSLTIFMSTLLLCWL